jgi:hypothetical protein
VPHIIYVCVCLFMQLTQELLLTRLLGGQQQPQASSASAGQPAHSAGTTAAVGQHMGGPGAASGVLHHGPGGQDVGQIVQIEQWCD